MPEFQPVRILYMEDDPGHARLLQKRLEQAGYSVDLARDGEEGLAMCNEGSYDVLLVDHDMPVYEGMEVLRILASRGSMPPTIMVTGAGNEEIAVEALKLGAEDYLVKDLQGGYFDLLPHLIEGALRQRRLVEEKQQAEEALRKSEERLRLVIENMPVLMDAFDANGEILAWNQECERVTGFSAEEIVGNPRAVQLLYPDEDYRTFIIEQLAKYGGKFRNLEWDISCKDGSKKTILWSNMSEQFPVPGWYSWAVGLDITERVRAEKQIKAALAEKEVLLQEIHHRVKNNLQALIYLIDMQAETLQNPETISVLREFQGRARAMSTVHEKLYQAKDLGRVDFGDYLQDLTAYLHHALARGRPIALYVDVPERIFIDVNIATPCGLIVNELVTNALKHAFPEGQASQRVGESADEIRVGFGLHEGEYVLTVSDNGVGLPPELDWRATESLGLKLVNIWATYQLQGSLEVDTQPGTTFTIRLAEPERGD